MSVVWRQHNVSLLASLLVLLLWSAPVLGQERSEEDRVVAVFFDVGGTLAYREPQTGKFAWYDDALSTLTALRKSGVRTALLSNVPRGWDEAMLARLLTDPQPLATLFDLVVLAQSPPPPGAPPPKPEPLAFTTAVARLGGGVRPSQVLYVGEDVAEVRGARLAGMQAILLMRRGSTAPRDCVTIRNLGQLLDHLASRD